MSIAVLVAFIAEIFSRFSSLAKLGAEKATSRADARTLFTKTVDLAKVFSDWFFIDKTINYSGARAGFSLKFLQSWKRKSGHIASGLWTI
jgi:hypothetical protein